MKIAALVACITAAVLFAPSADADSGLSFASRTILCRTTSITFTFSTLQGGAIGVRSGSDYLVTATPQGAAVDARLSSGGASARWVPAHVCKRLRVRTQPKAIIPRPSYSGDTHSECLTPNSIVAHIHYLRAGGRVTGIYVSVRAHRTGRFIVAGLLTARGTTRFFVGRTCVAR